MLLPQQVHTHTHTPRGSVYVSVGGYEYEKEAYGKLGGYLDDKFKLLQEMGGRGEGGRRSGVVLCGREGGREMYALKVPLRSGGGEGDDRMEE